jgi:hypothetical protein
MKKLTLLVACLSGCSFSNIQSKMIPNKLEEYRFNTLDVIKKHNDKHRDCLLNKLYPLIETIPIAWFDGDKYSSAYILNGVVYINKNVWRTSKDITVTIIHEVIHIYGMCLDDTVKQFVPICFVFNKPIYHSTDITKHIEDHLKEY